MSRTIVPRRSNQGRKPNALRFAIIERFNLSYCRTNLSRDLPAKLAEQIERCQSDEARRLLLGIGERA